MFIDHDLHIHSHLSTCSSDPGQTAEAILAYAKANGYHTVCITDHYWDEDLPVEMEWYRRQNTEHIRQILPLPQAEGIRFLFGCEADMDLHGTVGMTRERAKEFDFIVVSTTHMHKPGFSVRGDEDAAERAKLWVSRFDALLESGLPLEKCGIAHLTTPLIHWGADCLDVLRRIPDEEMIRLFSRAAKRGLGIELNSHWCHIHGEGLEVCLRPFRIAKEEGCRFYLGSDCHHPQNFEAMPAHFARITELLELDDTHKFTV